MFGSPLPEWVWAVSWGNIVGAISVVVVGQQNTYFNGILLIITLLGFAIYGVIRQLLKKKKQDVI